MGLSFLRGLVAAVNPCAFVLLPTYLMYFLGLEGQRPGSQRSSVRRALSVSGSVSAGFLAVFLTVGVVSEYVTRWIEVNAKYATAVIGTGFVVLGIAMLAGARVPITTPAVGVGGRDRTLSSMFLYGVAYAVASIGCTLPLFSTTLFGHVGADGWGSGLVHVVAYGAGMALIVTALTIALAVANTGLLRVLRGGSRYFHRITAALVTLSGAYLLYYFWVVEVNEGTSPVTLRVERLQNRVRIELDDHWRIVATVLALIVGAAVLYVLGRRDDAGGPARVVPSPAASSAGTDDAGGGRGPGQVGNTPVDGGDRPDRRGAGSAPGSDAHSGRATTFGARSGCASTGGAPT